MIKQLSKRNKKIYFFELFSVALASLCLLNFFNNYYAAEEIRKINRENQVVALKKERLANTLLKIEKIKSRIKNNKKEDVFTEAQKFLKVEGTKINIKLYEGSLYDKDNQILVDKKDGGAYLSGNGIIMIGDHSFEGFWEIDTIPLGSKAYIESENKVDKYILVNKAYGENHGNGYLDKNGDDLFYRYENDLMMCTCLDTTGKNVVVTYWTLEDSYE